MPRKKVPDDKRKRVAQACELCRRRKSKCDGKKQCFFCSKRGVSCGYSYDTKSPSPSPSPSVETVSHSQEKRSSPMASSAPMNNSMILPSHTKDSTLAINQPQSSSPRVEIPKSGQGKMRDRPKLFLQETSSDAEMLTSDEAAFPWIRNWNQDQPQPQPQPRFSVSEPSSASMTQSPGSFAWRDTSHFAPNICGHEICATESQGTEGTFNQVPVIDSHTGNVVWKDAQQLSASAPEPPVWMSNSETEAYNTDPTRYPFQTRPYHTEQTYIENVPLSLPTAGAWFGQISGEPIGLEYCVYQPAEEDIMWNSLVTNSHPGIPGYEHRPRAVLPSNSTRREVVPEHWEAQQQQQQQQHAAQCPRDKFGKFS